VVEHCQFSSVIGFIGFQNPIQVIINLENLPQKGFIATDQYPGLYEMFFNWFICQVDEMSAVVHFSFQNTFLIMPCFLSIYLKILFMLCHSKVMDVFIKAAEYMEMPVRRSDDEPLKKLFLAVRSELNLDLKNIKTEQAKFWKQHPSLVKVRLWLRYVLTQNDLCRI
jgi:hypothetical protein